MCAVHARLAGMSSGTGGGERTSSHGAAALLDRLKDGARRAARRMGWDVGRYDPFLRLEDYLQRIVFPFLEVDCVVDVGAHTGEYGQRLRKAGYAGPIVSFEPVAEPFAALSHRAASDARWRVHQVALGRSDEHLEINVAATTQFSSLRWPRHDAVDEFVAMGHVVERREPIVVRRLDAVFDDVTAGLDVHRAFLKMDTQGWDLEVIAGAVGILDRVVGVQSELSVLPIYEEMPHLTEALQAYAAHNFEISATFPVSRDRHLRLVELDCVLVRRS